jgi:CubicO group peptidase (beta-lactamase class C family)
MRKLRDYFGKLQAGLPPAGPGFSAIVIRDGEPLFELHHGMASLELKVPLSTESAYYLASESKQFTAACVMSLVRKGLVGLDDDVGNYLPELARFEQAFPLRSLLNHSSGIPDYFQFIQCQFSRHEADYFNNGHILRLISCLDTVDFPTSSEHRYSNSNYILLATLVERLVRTPLARYAKTTLFEPLGMEGFTFDEDRFSVIDYRVFSYETDQSRPRGYKQNLGNANTVGDGGIYGSIRELVLWEREWHRQWTDASSLLNSMLQASPLADGTVPSYRFGLEIIQSAGHHAVFHGGRLWGFNTLLLRLPAHGISIIHLANCEPAAPDMQQIMSAAFEDLCT